MNSTQIQKHLSDYLLFPRTNSSPDMLEARARILISLCTCHSLGASENGSWISNTLYKELDILFRQIIYTIHNQEEIKIQFTLLDTAYRLVLHTAGYTDSDKEEICITKFESLFREYKLTFSREIQDYPANVMACAAHYLTLTGIYGESEIANFYKAGFQEWFATLSSTNNIWSIISDSEAWKRISIIAADSATEYLPTQKDTLKKLYTAYCDRLPCSITSTQELHTRIAHIDALINLSLIPFFPISSCNTSVPALHSRLCTLVPSARWQAASCAIAVECMTEIQKKQDFVFL